jgi:hypothetical protein
MTAPEQNSRSSGDLMPKIDVDALLAELDLVAPVNWPNGPLHERAARCIRFLRAEHEALRADFERAAVLAEKFSGGRGSVGMEIRDARARWTARRAQQEKT